MVLVQVMQHFIILSVMFLLHNYDFMNKCIQFTKGKCISEVAAIIRPLYSKYRLSIKIVVKYYTNCKAVIFQSSFVLLNRLFSHKNFKQLCSIVYVPSGFCFFEFATENLVKLFLYNHLEYALIATVVC